MSNNLRDIRRKTKAIKSTKQVTKALELISASKMRRAVQSAQMLRRYALGAWHILQSIGKVHTQEHPFLRQRPVEKVLAIVFTSDRGQCGSFNTQVFRTINQYMKGVSGLKTYKEIDFVTIGRKGNQFLLRTGHNVIATFPALSNHPAFKDVLPVAKLALDSFTQNTYDHVVMIYTDFLSPLYQEPAVKVLLPFSRSEMSEMVTSLIHRKQLSKEAEEDLSHPSPDILEYTFEPDPQEVLDVILPQLAEVQVYQAVLESVASEHAARMVAMRNASENASDIIEDLTLLYNQTRQAGITAELAELSASKAALD